MNGPVGTPSRRRFAAGGAVLVGVLVLTACNDDGRTLRPPRPDQVASVSTLAPSPTEVPGFDAGGLTLPAEPTTTPSLAPTTTLGSPSTTTGSPGVSELTTSWRDGAPIAARYTCDGADLAPALRWTNVPAETVEIAVTMRDEDAPGFVHWAMAGIDPLSTSLGEAQVPEFALVSENSRGELGYAGPCPPAGESHHYILTVHFLGEQTELPDGGPGADLLASIDERSLASATVTGVYSRP